MSHLRDRSSGRGGSSLRAFSSGLVLVALGAALGVALGVLGMGPQPSPQAPVLAGGRDRVATHAPFVVEPATRLQAAVRERAPTTVVRAHEARGVPLRLVVPRLRVDAPVIGIDVVGEVLLPPGDPQTLGWWRDGALPGDRYGSALITGHTVHSGGGAFDDLETLEVGDQVWVGTTGGRIAYRVAGVTVYRKASLAQDAQRIFSQTVPGRLVLVTCEDWDGSRYLSNAVVFADPVPR